MKNSKTNVKKPVKKPNIKIVARIFKAFGFICLGAYIAVAVECGIDATIGAGIVLSVCLAGVSIFFERFKRVNYDE